MSNQFDPMIPWPKLLQQCVEQYNNTPHEITGFSLRFLLLGTPPYKYHTEAHGDLHTARQQPLHRTNHYHQRNKIKYDNNRVNPDFAVGESVLVKNLWQAGDGKLKPFYSGPFKIIERTSPVTMKINQKRKGCTTSIVHVSD